MIGLSTFVALKMHINSGFSALALRTSTQRATIFTTSKQRDTVFEYVFTNLADMSLAQQR